MMADERERDRFCSVAHLNLPSPPPPRRAPPHTDTSLRLFPLKDSLFQKKKSLSYFFFPNPEFKFLSRLPLKTPAVPVTDDPNGFSETSASSPLIAGAGTGVRSCHTATVDIDVQLCRPSRPPLWGTGFFFLCHLNRDTTT